MNHDAHCTWPDYKEPAPGTSFWGELSYLWSMEFCEACKADPSNKVRDKKVSA